MVDVAAMTAVIYERLGTPAVHVAGDGVVTQGLRVIVEVSGASLDGVVMAESPRLKMPAAALPEGIRRGDLFEVGPATWRAREDGVAIRGGAELTVPLARAA